MPKLNTPQSPARKKFRPFRARKDFSLDTQGVALGFHLMPRWGNQ